MHAMGACLVCGGRLQGPLFYCVVLVVATVLCWRTNPAGEPHSGQLSKLGHGTQAVFLLESLCIISHKVMAKLHWVAWL